MPEQADDRLIVAKEKHARLAELRPPDTKGAMEGVQLLVCNMQRQGIGIPKARARAPCQEFWARYVRRMM